MTNCKICTTKKINRYSLKKKNVCRRNSCRCRKSFYLPVIFLCVFNYTYIMLQLLLLQFFIYISEAIAPIFFICLQGFLKIHYSRQFSFAHFKIIYHEENYFDIEVNIQYICMMLWNLPLSSSHTCTVHVHIYYVSESSFSNYV